MTTFWQKIKDFFKRIWHGLTVAGRIIVGVLLIALIAAASFLITKNSDNDDKDEADTPEVAQVYEPSIGSPLPADTPGTRPEGTSGTVSGDVTTTPFTPPTPTVATDSAMTAPPTGIDPTAPIAYRHDALKFTTTLPAGASVDEQPGKITFTANTRVLLYTVSTEAVGTETLQSIQTQLSNSPSAGNIKQITFAGQTALQFDAKDYGTGIVFIANGKIYYLLGNSQYFASFKLF